MNESFAEAIRSISDSMAAKNIGAIIWDNSAAGFHYLPVATSESGQPVRVTGLYRYDDRLYLIDETNPRANIDLYYDRDTEVRPVVICLSPSVAPSDLGNPGKSSGFTTQASDEEWVVIADCYLEALNEK